MKCCVTDLRNKEVISKTDGCRLGHVCDVDVDTCTGQVVALIIYGPSRWFGLFGREDDLRICWDEVDVIGEDTILVCRRPERPPGRKKKKSMWESFIKIKTIVANGFYLAYNMSKCAYKNIWEGD